MKELDLPLRTKQPRTYGITSTHDVMLTVGELENILHDYGNYIDIAKLGVGSAYVTPRLGDKIKLYQSYNVDVYFGGTLFEKFFHQNRLEHLKKFMSSNNINMVEISTGTVDMNLDERLALVADFKRDFRVLSEVGSKDGDKVMPPSVWINEIQSLLAAGCEYVITEGRNSGTAGIYRPSGEIRSGLIDDVIATVDYKKLIFEAPTPKSQMFFINLAGANVNLGNVNPRDLLLLEAQRQGLRSETFFMNDPKAL